MATKVANLTEAKTAAVQRADEIERQLAVLEAERAEAAADVVLGKDDAASRLAKVAERIGRLVQERGDLGLAVEEIARREAQAAARAKEAERQRFAAERDQEVEARNKLYDEFAVLIEKAAAIAPQCLVRDGNIARLTHALGEQPEPATRLSKIRLHSFIEWKFAQAGLHPEFSWPHPTRRVHPKNW